MLDNLADLFPSDKIQRVSELLSSVNNFVKFIEDRVGNDPTKTNEVIEHIKNIFDQYKK